MVGRTAGGHRRPHRKSRTGCQQCKARKIKCDEQKPSCGHCVRFSTECSFLKPTAPISSPASNATTAFNGASSSNGSLSSSVHSSNHSGLELEVQNLELLHFFTTTTSLTLSNLPEQQRLWQHVVPKLAFAQPFLLRGLLALSATHLGRLHADRQGTLTRLATLHHTEGVTLFRNAMSSFTPENCDACFAFSTLLVIYAWSSSGQKGDLFFADSSKKEGGTVEWIVLLRGCRSLFEVGWTWMYVENGPLKPLLRLTNDEGSPPPITDFDKAPNFRALATLWDNSRTHLNPDEVDALQEALSLLTEVYGLLSLRDRVNEVGTALSWPTRVRDRYIEMVSQQKPEALVVLAHYCLLLNKIDHFWFMAGMSRHLLQTIHRTLGKEWESWIVWPLQDLVLSEFNSQAGENSCQSGMGVFG